jgi:hypothetical protein
LCLDPHDLAISKLMAGREKDLEYLRVAADSGLLNRETLLGLIDPTPVEPERRDMARGRVGRLFTVR